MYTLGVRRDFIARHYLVGGDWGPEDRPNSHHYILELQLTGEELDQHGYLCDIVEVEKNLDEIIGYYKEQMLNEKPESVRLNPSIEHFARILWHCLERTNPGGKYLKRQSCTVGTRERMGGVWHRTSQVKRLMLDIGLMKIGLVIYGSIDTLSGGYIYDRKLVEYLRAQGETVEITSLPWRNYPSHLLDNLHFRLPRGLDLLIQDELNHPSLISANVQPHPFPVCSVFRRGRSPG